MKSYFLTELDRNMAKKLREAGIPYSRRVLRRVSGIIIEEEHISSALIKLELTRISETYTLYDEIYHLVVALPNGKHTKPFPRRWNVRVKSWDSNYDSESKRRLLPLVEKFLTVIKKDIVIDVPHKHRCPPVEDGNFHIHIWSSPSGSPDYKPPEKIWGVQVNCRDDSFLPSGKGISFVDPHSGWAVAELVENNLYVHHDICHHGTKYEAAIFAHLLEEVGNEMTATPTERIELAKQRYIRACMGRHEKNLKTTVEHISKGEEDIAKLQADLVKRIREVQGLQRKLEQLQSLTGDDEIKYGEEFDKLIELPKVTGININGNVLSVLTETLYCVDTRDDLLHEIGKFRIDLYMDGSNGCVRWFNLTRRVSGHKTGMSHPHIYEDGKACLGNATEVFPQLLANNQYDVAVMYAIRFVESVNTEDSAGAHINKWPLAPKGVKRD